MIRAISVASMLSIAILTLAPAWAADVASEPATPTLVFPRISSAGGVFALPEGVEMPAADRIHRVLIDATGGETTASGTNRHLEAAARAVNLYALAGVPAENVQVAVVVHGKATPLVLSEAAYLRKFSRPHPDSALLAALRQAGVEIHVCGQSLTHQGHAVTDVHERVDVALSAMTKMVELQTDGYGIIP